MRNLSYLLQYLESLEFYNMSICFSNSDAYDESEVMHKQDFDYDQFKNPLHSSIRLQLEASNVKSQVDRTVNMEQFRASLIDPF